MRTHATTILLAVMVSVLLAGCGGQQEERAPTAAEPSSGMSTSDGEAAGAIEQAKAEAEAAKKAAQEAAAKAEAELQARKEKMEEEAARVKAEAEAKAQAVNTQFKNILAEIKANIKQKSYENALAKIREGLRLENLTEEQKGILQNLMETVKTAMSKQAAGDVKNKVGDFLNQ